MSEKTAAYVLNPIRRGLEEGAFKVTFCDLKGGAQLTEGLLESE